MEDLNLPYNDRYQKNIEDKIIKNFQNFKSKIDLKKIDMYSKLFKKYIITKTTNKKLQKFPLVLYTIKNNKIIINKKFTEIIDKKDERVCSMFNLFEKTIEWALKKKLKIPDINIYFWIMDNMPYLSNDLDDFPLWVFSKTY